VSTIDGTRFHPWRFLGGRLLSLAWWASRKIFLVLARTVGTLVAGILTVGLWLLGALLREAVRHG
jgi:hypothetical protein